MNPGIAILVEIVVGAILLKLFLPWIGRAQLNIKGVLWASGLGVVFGLVPPFILGAILYKHFAAAMVLGVVLAIFVQSFVIRVLVIAADQQITKTRAVSISTLLMLSQFVIAAIGAKLLSGY